MHLPEFTPPQICLLEVIYEGLCEARTWPTTAYVDAKLASRTESRGSGHPASRSTVAWCFLDGYSRRP